MNEMLTIDEIESRYAPEWVLIGEPKIDENLRVGEGRCFSIVQIATRFIAKRANCDRDVSQSDTSGPGLRTRLSFYEQPSIHLP